MSTDAPAREAHRPDQQQPSSGVGIRGRNDRFAIRPRAARRFRVFARTGYFVRRSGGAEGAGRPDVRTTMRAVQHAVRRRSVQPPGDGRKGASAARPDARTPTARPLPDAGTAAAAATSAAGGRGDAAVFKCI